MKIVILGGGTAGWMAASYLSKRFRDFNLTVIESPNIPRIGVGESVTPHVAQFFTDLGIDTHTWMKDTGSVYKWANKFINWHNGNDYEYFSFSYPTNTEMLYKDIDKPFSIDQVYGDKDNELSTDYLLKLYNDGHIDKFDRYFNSQFYYMENNVAPFEGTTRLLNVPFSGAQHIDAEKAADFLKDNVALRNGVEHLQHDVVDIIVDGENIKYLVLESGEQVVADLFLDATGFKRILTKALGWTTVKYKNNPINRAWVCPLEYENKETELLNYTQSIAQNHGWLFKIGLNHRMGSGYCFSSEFTDDDDALKDYMSITKNHKAEPRLIKWTPERLKYSAKGNTVAIGLSCGFVEPMEANALYTIINSIVRLAETIESCRSINLIDYTEYNNIIAHGIDDISDFILVHYTLSNRKTNAFWNEMSALGVRNNHIDLMYEKYRSKFNTMSAALQGYTMFPQYMWAQLATYLKIDTSTWYDLKEDVTYEIAKLYFKNLEHKHRLISSTRMNNSQWLSKYIFR